MRSVRIPADRVGTLIGRKGEVKRTLQKISGIKMDIDAEEGEVVLHDDVELEDPYKALQLMDVVRAVGRGFSPEKAMRLFEDDEYLEVIDLKEVVGDRTNQVTRVRGRLIGKDGKTRRIIEDLTGCDMTIYGNTVALIGNSVSLPVAKHAVEMILQGSEHATVYHYLEGQRARLRIAEMGFDLRGRHGGLDRGEDGDRGGPRARGALRPLPREDVREARHRDDQRRPWQAGPRGPAGGRGGVRARRRLPLVRGHLRRPAPLRRERRGGGERRRVGELPRGHPGGALDTQGRGRDTFEARNRLGRVDKDGAEPRDREAGTSAHQPRRGVREPPGRRPR